MNRFKIVNLAILGTIFLLLHLGVEADCRSSCSLPGLPGRDGVAGQPGRDGRDGVPGPAGTPGGQLHGYLHDKCDTPTITTQVRHVQTHGRQSHAIMKPNPSIAAPGVDGTPGIAGSPGEQGPPGPSGPPGTPGTSGGTTYIRWGRTVCPNVTGTELVYDGLAAGTHFTQMGGGANYICVANGADVEYHPEATTTNSNQAILHATEYEIPSGRPLDDLHDHNVPCAVCEVSSRSKQIMIPGRYTCPDTWTVEYSGWLMTERYTFYRSMFVCLDKTPETVVGRASDTEGALMYHVEADCGTGLPCPNYDAMKELSCVVCTK